MNDVIQNVTASFQGVLPPNSPVNNITFGFGGPGIIGYLDLHNQFGDGTFIINPVPEPGTGYVFLSLACLFVAYWSLGPARRRAGALSD